MNNYIKKLSIIIGLIATTFTACKKDEADDFNPIQNEEELITSVVLTFVDSTNITDTSTFAFRDPDGEGGNAPTVFDTISLLKGKTYFMSIAFLDESNPNNVEDITVEVKAEDDEHIVCYESLNLSSLSYSITDSDGQFPVGLEATFRTDISQIVNNGSLKVTLKHQPGVKDGSCAPGDTDVEINFPTVIN